MTFFSIFFTRTSGRLKENLYLSLLLPTWSMAIVLLYIFYQYEIHYFFTCLSSFFDHRFIENALIEMWQRTAAAARTVVAENFWQKWFINSITIYPIRCPGSFLENWWSTVGKNLHILLNLDNSIILNSHTDAVLSGRIIDHVNSITRYRSIHQETKTIFEIVSFNWGSIRMHII